MIELRFHAELYDGFAIDEAVKTYSEFATFELSKEAGGFIVKVHEKPEEEGGADAALVAMELLNFALGKTIERSRTSDPSKATDTVPSDPAKEAS